MSDLINWQEWLTDLSNQHERITKVLTYILTKSGGILWPILYVVMLWQSWKTLYPHSLFVWLGIILTIVALIYPRTWKHYINKREAEINSERDSYQKRVAHLGSLYTSFMEYLEGVDLWPLSREKGIEQKLLDANQEILNVLNELNNSGEKREDLKS